MSTVKLQGNSSGGGSVTLVSPNLSSDITVTLPNTTTTLGSASTTAGDVGTYAFLSWSAGSPQNQGTTVSGSSVKYANAGNVNVAGSSSVSPSGTWRLMGALGYYSGGTTITNVAYYSSVFVRIS